MAVDGLKEIQTRAEQGDAGAQDKLGVMYYEGQGVPQNYAEAVKWLRKAAAQNDASAQRHLAFCYANGRGVVKDEAEAFKWDLLAAAQGDTEAKRNASLLELLMLSKEEIAEGKKRAQDWLEQRKNDSPKKTGTEPRKDN